MTRIFFASAITLALFTVRGYSATCSNATLNGSYAYQDTQQDQDGITYVVRYLIFDGAGKGSTNWITQNINGAVVVDPVGVPITYTVDKTACIFSFTQPNGLTFTGVIGNNANELNYVETIGSQFRRGSAIKVTSQNQQ